MTESAAPTNIITVADSRLPWWLLLAACGGFAASLTWNCMAAQRAQVDTAREELIHVLTTVTHLLLVNIF
jgi:hypothetical protein